MKKVILAALVMSVLYDLSVPVILGVQIQNGWANVDNPPPPNIEPWLVPILASIALLGLLTIGAFVVALRNWDEMSTGEKWLLVPPAIPGFVALSYCFVIVAVIAFGIWIYNAGRWSGGSRVLIDSDGRRGRVDAGGDVTIDGEYRGRADADGTVRLWGTPTGKIEKRG